MTKVRKNILLLVFGRGSSSAVNFVMLPLYLPLLGKEAFGLVALGLSLVQLVAFINEGLQPVWVREISRRTALGESIAPLIRSQEYLRGLLLLVIVIFHDRVAETAISGVTLVDMNTETAVTALSVLLLGLGFMNFGVTYGLVFWGRQEGKKCAFMVGAKPIWDSVGGYIVLLVTKGNPIAFFMWQALGSLLLMLIAGLVVWIPLGTDFFKLCLKASQFKGLGTIGGLSMVLAALMAGVAFGDRWSIGAVLSVSAVATYSLMMQPIVLVSNLVGSISTHLTARFSELVALGDGNQVNATFSKGTRIGILALLLPVLALVTAPTQLYYLWLHDLDLAREIGKLAPLAILNIALLTQTALVYQTEIAKGRMKFYVIMTAFRLIVIVLFWKLLLLEFGILGTLAASLAVTLLECLLIERFIVSRMSKGSGPRWLIDIFAVPATILIPAILASYYLSMSMPGNSPLWQTLAVKLFLPLSIVSAISLIVPTTRRQISEILCYLRIPLPLKLRNP